MEPQKLRFWAGNIVLGVALIILLNMGVLSERYGMSAVILWMILVAVGFYLILSGKEPPGSMPE